MTKYNSRCLDRNSGQVALIVLLVSAVVMTIGLSSAKKTTLETKIETNEEQLKQAFNAAESGIEYYLGTGKTSFTSIDSLSRADVTVKNVGVGTTVNFDNFILAGSLNNYWLAAHNSDGTINYGSYYPGNSLKLCVESGFNGALKVDYFYRNGGNYYVKRLGFNYSDNYVSGFVNGNQTAGQGSCIAGHRELTLNVPLTGNIPLLAVVKPLRTGTRMYLLGSGGNFPVQGVELNSVGRVGGASSGVNRTVKVVRTFQLPEFMVDAVTGYGNVLSN